MASYISDYTGKQIDTVIKLFNNKGLDSVYGILVRKAEDNTFAAIDGTNYKIDWGWIDGNTIPTTLSGYGITDAKIENGTIILGSNSIMPVPTSMIETTATDSDSKISTSKAMRTYVDTYGGKIDTISVNGTPQTITNKNVNLIVATLKNGKIPQSQLPSYVDDVLEFANRSAFPISGESGKIYVALDTNLTYRWSGSEYVEISQSLALGETDSTAYRGDRGKIAYDHAIAKGSQFASGLYKIKTNSEGHVTAAVAVQKSDLTGLGVQETLVSGTNIKTINNQSLLGSGNIDIQGDIDNIFIAMPNETSYSDISSAIQANKVIFVNDEIAFYIVNYMEDRPYIYLYSYIGRWTIHESDSEWTFNQYFWQEKLVSGSNIKTINNQSLLDSGNMSLQPILTAGTGITIDSNNVISVNLVNAETQSF